MEQYPHIRILMGMVLGLSITVLLKGLAQFVQHPGRQKVYWVHIGWAIMMFVLLVHFWWWEYRLVHIDEWTFVKYGFLIFYIVLFFLLCTLLFPDDLREYSGYRDYFMSRRKWFFGLMALSYVLDLGDTLLKGRFYFEELGTEYLIRNALYVALCLVAIRTRSQAFHFGFVAIALLHELSWIYRLYDYL
ncbi:hypothetical protein [Marilutibacter alkalisoli]|uniref:Uncharacterized protein n=1 Tax=Marilutibacter alkalisoli TaxID=2591633 RepID=A0A514BRC8_9GAMM|nr:hypothetical protein [Lysobacter alkalisoli]QDH69569.1 hypothetical protein FKV23_05280 [Lysobacter alkalisoli]